MKFEIGDIVHVTNKYKKGADDIGIVINITSHCYPEYLFYVDFGNSVGAYTADDLELVGEIFDNAIVNSQLKKRGLISIMPLMVAKKIMDDDFNTLKRKSLEAVKKMNEIDTMVRDDGLMKKMYDRAMGERFITIKEDDLMENVWLSRRDYTMMYTARYKKEYQNFIKKVVFNNPATIVFWNDGTKTVVKCQDKETYDPEKGLAMAIAKKALGNEGNYYEVFKTWLPGENK